MAIHSRAFLLLKRDLVTLQRFPLAGIWAAPTDSSNLFHWTAKIEGLSGTIWEGGVFQVILRYSEDFNCKPPLVNFMTIPYHPNVDPTDGSPSFHLYSEDDWSCEKHTTSSLLLALQALLSSPELESGCILNTSAALLYKNAPHTYKQMVLDCVTASLRIDAGLTPYEAVTPPQSPNLTTAETAPPVSRQTKPAKPISYDDYHVLWKGIATSVSEYKQSNDFVQLLEKDAKLGTIHRGHRDRHTNNLATKIDQHADIKYGKAPRSKKVASLNSNSRLKRVEDLKNMYRKTEGIYDTPLLLSQGIPLNIDTTIVEDNGDEVDQLVQWTKDLNEQHLLVS